MIIGEIIKWCRTNKKFTQEEMAAALHITPQAISRWETGTNVLIVDDAPFMRMMLKEILSSDGHTIIQATNGEECLTILETTPIDTCILDINMPVMDGMQALTIIKNKYPQIKVIMLSAQCTEDTVQKALLFGADGFVAKPFAANTILERMY